MKYINKLLPPAVLATIVLLVFARTLGSYFLEDDFGEICYCSNIADGNVHMLFSNFTGNYMQIPGMNVYRPFLLVSLLFDYLLWRTNAFGYYLTNLVFMFGTAYMLYLVLRTLTAKWNEKASVTASLCSAALFAANPLHSEAVSLVVGRVDIVCAFYYLLSYWCLIKRGTDNNRCWTVAGILAFWFAMLTKEMAIGLPILLFATAFIKPELFPCQSAKKAAEVADGDIATYSFKDRLRIAFNSSWALWLNTVLYFVVRYLTLGTFTGGYVGSEGSNMLHHVWERWTEPGTVERILFPLNVDVSGPALHDRFVLTLVYLTLSALLIFRFIFYGIPWRWFAIALTWILTTLIPIYQLWGLSDYLEGSRFIFFLTMPLSALAPLLIFAPSPSSKTPELTTIFKERLLPTAAFALSVLTILFASLSYKNNVPWLHAGKQTRACQEEAARLAEKIGPNKKAVLLGIPKQRGGAHMILNGVTFDIMLSPPYFQGHPEKKFVLFEPYVFGHNELINSQRLEECMSDPSIEGIYVWNDKTMKFDRLSNYSKSENGTDGIIDVLLPSNLVQARPCAPDNGDWRVENNVLTIKNSQKNPALEISPLFINPYDFDFVEFDIRRRAASHEDSAIALWKSQCQPRWRDESNPSEDLLPPSSSAEFQHCRIRLSNHWSWYTGGNILSLQIQLPDQTDMQIKNLRIISSKNVAPVIHIKSLVPSNLGFYDVPERLDLSIDAEQVTGCKSVQLQITKPNYFFQDYVGSQTKDAILRKMTKPGQQKDFSIAARDLPAVGYYQLRAVCLDAQGHEIGEPSSEATLYKSGRPL
jgi:hypothetical protein